MGNMEKGTVHLFSMHIVWSNNVCFHTHDFYMQFICSVVLISQRKTFIFRITGIDPIFGKMIGSFLIRKYVYFSLQFTFYFLNNMEYSTDVIFTRRSCSSYTFSLPTVFYWIHIFIVSLHWQCTTAMFSTAEERRDTWRRDLHVRK